MENHCFRELVKAARKKKRFLETEKKEEKALEKRESFQTSKRSNVIFLFFNQSNAISLLQIFTKFLTQHNSPSVEFQVMTLTIAG